MKRVTIFILAIMLTFLFACSSNDSRNNSDDFEKKQKIIKESNVNNNEFTKDDAILKVIKYHNTSDDVEFGYEFPISIKENNPVTTQIDSGGRHGSKLLLKQTVEVIKNKNEFIITLKEDYNIKIQGKDVISYWKYDVSSNNLKLIEKNEGGKAIQVIK